MPHPPIRISRAGALGRADMQAWGTTVTVLSTRPGVVAAAALPVCSGLALMDVAGAATRARAADRLAAMAAEAAGCGVLVTIGGDVAVAGTAPVEGWRVRIADGVAPAPAQVRMTSGGVATARPTGDGGRWRSVTVVARSCRMARAAAASAADRDEDAPAWLTSVGLTARLVGSDGTLAYTGRWPSEQVAA
jgi:thiamine biosynthesis lipoprotein